MRSLRYRDSAGHEGVAGLRVEGGRVFLDYEGDPLDFNLADLRAALEAEAFATGPVIPAGPGAKTGQRRAA